MERTGNWIRGSVVQSVLQAGNQFQTFKLGGSQAHIAPGPGDLTLPLGLYRYNYMHMYKFIHTYAHTHFKIFSK